jgi:biopolymer transport protein ExbD
VLTVLMNVNQRFVVLLVTITCVLLATVLVVQDYSSRTRGHYVYVLNDPHYRQPCGDGRPIILKLRGDGDAEINKAVLAREAVSRRMEQIFSERCERALFLVADSNVPFRDVAAQMDELETRIPYLNIALVTKDEQLTRGCGPDIRHWQELHLPDCNTKTSRIRAVQ